MADLIATLQAVAGNAGGEGLYVEEVFSTYLYDGNGTTNSINNNINLNEEGGLVWLKDRGQAYPHYLYDTERGAGNTKALETVNTGPEGDNPTRTNLSSFDTDGFTLGATSSTNQSNENNEDYVSWSFRKAPKFFDVVTYTGTFATQTISHNLGSVPGCIIVKRRDTNGNWAVYHRGADSTSPEDYALYLNLTNARSDIALWNDTAPTDSEFTVFGNSSDVNASGGTYVAYLFAHNDGDGNFGETGDQDIIKCGSYTGNGTSGNEITVGFEPQWVLVKAAEDDPQWDNWFIYDSMRGMTDSQYNALAPNISVAESVGTSFLLYPTATGFKLGGGNNNFPNNNNIDYIYIAIRRGPMKTPEDATDVHAQDDAAVSQTEPYTAGFPTDWVFERVNSDTSGNWYAYGRVFGKNKYQTTATNAAIATNSGVSNLGLSGWDSQSKVDGFGYNDGDDIAYMFRRAQGFFDVQRFQGNATSGNTFNHALGVVPEFIMIKSGGAVHWGAYHKDMFSDTASEAYNGGITFEQNPVRNLNDNWWDDTAPTDSVVTLGNGNYSNGNNVNVALLFASVPGVCHIGSYTGTGSAQNIDCGFSAGARFVVVKCVTAGQQWFIKIRNQDNGMTFNDTTQPQNNLFPSYSSGFGVSSADAVSASGEHFIYIAIA